MVHRRSTQARVGVRRVWGARLPVDSPAGFSLEHYLLPWTRSAQQHWGIAGATFCLIVAVLASVFRQHRHQFRISSRPLRLAPQQNHILNNDLIGMIRVQRSPRSSGPTVPWNGSSATYRAPCLGSRTAQEILAAADAAMYEAKLAGRGRFVAALPTAKTEVCGRPASRPPPPKTCTGSRAALSITLCTRAPAGPGRYGRSALARKPPIRLARRECGAGSG